MKNLLLVVMGMLFLHLCNAQSHTCPPLNEVSKDPTLQKFVSELKQIIVSKDKSALIALLDKDVDGGIGDEGGVKGFIINWGLDKDSTSMWSLMSRAIELGGAYTHDTTEEGAKYQFVFPYTYNLNLDMDDDYENLGAITGSNVNLRKDPDSKSKVVTLLSYNVVWFMTDKEGGPIVSGKNSLGDGEWYLIKTYDKANRGWVNWNYVYSLMGPRLFLFKNNNGQWRISAFITGD